MASDDTYKIKQGPGELELAWAFFKQERIQLEVQAKNGQKEWESFWIEDMRWDGDYLALELTYFFHPRRDPSVLPIGARPNLKTEKMIAIRKGPGWGALTVA